MGVKKLGPFLRKHKCAVQVTLRDYQNQSVAVDAPIFLYRFLASRKRNYLSAFEQQLNSFAAHNIRPIYVFDGKPIRLKQNELQKRRKAKNKLAETAVNSDLPFYKRVQAQEKILAIPTHAHYDTLKQFLTAHDVEFEIARSDGEKLCAFYASARPSKHRCTTVFSQDFDTLAYGATKLTTIRHDASGLLEYSWAAITKTFEWTREQFTDFCILCGTDFTKINLRHFGPARSRKLIDEFNTIEDAVLHLKKSKIGFKEPSMEDFDYVGARNEFLGKDHVPVHHHQNDSRKQHEEEQ